MNTILPNFIDFNNRTAFYKTNSPYTSNMQNTIVTFVGVATIIIMMIYAFKSIDKSMIISCVNLTLLTVVTVVFIYLFNNVSDNNFNTNQYYTHGFHITNTNLIASAYQVDPNNDNPYGDMDPNMDPHKNYHISKYYVYVDLINTRPKGMYSDYVINEMPADLSMAKIIYGGWSSNNEHVDKDNKYNIVYLGYMENGKFIPNYQNTKIVHIFMEYQKYIKKHHLESKFKNHFSFEASHVYMTKNHNPVLVIIGDNDFTLHYKNDDIAEDLNIVQN